MNRQNALERYRGRDNMQPTVVESFTENVMYARPIVSFVNFVKIIAGIALLGLIAYGVYSIHDTFVKMVGQIANIFFICLEVILVVAALCLVAIMVRFAVDFVTRYTIVEPGDSGKHAYRFGRWLQLHPLEKQAPKPYQSSSTSTTTKVTNVAESVPTLATLLQEQVIKPGISHMLFCYTRDKKKELSALWGIWDDLKSFGVIGKPRKGKTNTLFFLIVQILLSRAKLYICDKHSTKKSGLLKMLKPLRQWYQYANDPMSIIKTFQAFSEELERRIAPLPDDAPEPDFEVWVLICDEWNGLLEQIRGYDEKRGTEYTDYIIKTATSLLREAAGYNMFIGLCIHAVTEYEIGSVPLRNNLHGVIAHGMEQGYSKYFFHDRKDNAQTPKLSLGEILFKNAETSDVTKGEVPLCSYEDAVTVASLIEDMDVSDFDNQTYVAGAVEPQQLHKPIREQIAQYSTYNASNISNVPNGNKPEYNTEHRQEAAGTAGTTDNDTSLTQAQVALLRKIGNLVQKGKTKTEIRKELVPDLKTGRALQEVNAAIEWIQQNGVIEEIAPAPAATTEALVLPEMPPLMPKSEE